MLKKIILGIVIVVVLSAITFGSIYAYQKEKAKIVDTTNNTGRSLQQSPGSGESCAEYTTGGFGDCPRWEERFRNKNRLQENDDQECIDQGSEFYGWLYGYEKECPSWEERQQELDESGKYGNKNGDKGNGGRNGI